MMMTTKTSLGMNERKIGAKTYKKNRSRKKNQVMKAKNKKKKEAECKRYSFLSEASDLSLKTLSQASPGACNLNFS
jgi:hypothetical protein